MKSFRLVSLALAACVLAVSPALSQESPALAEVPAPADIPKTKGAYLIVALTNAPLTVAMSNAKACEEERARLAKQSITSYCVWVR